tara:strand:- start:9992 stop:10699 length:708 start_codon:yes stop_codon:yes gene_type:complete
MKKTAYIIGTGPSLKNVDMSLLKDKDTITFNRAYVAFEDWGFEPTYFLAIDGNDLRSVYKDINQLVTDSNIKKFYLLNPTDNAIHESDSFQDNEKVDKLFEDSDKIHFLHDHEIVPNAGIMGLYVLKQMGYEEVAFLGCDARYKDDEESNKHITMKGREYISHADYDVNHFTDKYFGKGIHFGKPNEQEIINLWRSAKQEIDASDDFNVYSCTEGSNLNEFYKYIKLEDFINGER